MAWSFRRIHKGQDLLKSLETITGLLGRHLSATSLAAGIPLGEDGYTAEELMRSAAKFQLLARVIKRPIEQIHSATFPVILELKDNKSCVLEAVIEKVATVYFPDGKGKSTVIALEDLQALYAGTVIYVTRRLTHENPEALQKPLRWFWDIIKLFIPTYRHVATSSVLINLFLLISTIYAMNIYDRVLPNHAYDTLWVLSSGVFVVYAFDFVLRMLRGYFIDIAGRNADILLGAKIYERILHVHLGSHPPSPTVLAHYLREFESVREFFASSTLIALVDVPFALLFLAVIALISPVLIWVPIFSILIVLVATLLLNPSMKGSVEGHLGKLQAKHGLLVESVQGLETIKSHGAEGHMMNRYEMAHAGSAVAAARVYYYSLLSGNFTNLVQNVSYVFLIIFGVFEVTAAHITIGGLIAITIMSTRAIASMSAVTNLINRYNQVKSSLTTMDRIVTLPSERPAHVQFFHRPDLKGEIEFIEVDFAYPGSPTHALRGLSFHIRPGEKVAFIGKVGSGKTTVEKLMLGLYHPLGGKILIDGTDIRQIDPTDLRSIMGYVPQDIHLFRGTVEENIAISEAVINEEDILRAAEQSGVNDFVQNHPEGFDMMIGDGGSGLSGGQRQAIAIARALLHDPKLLLLDEPSASMDPYSEMQLIQNLKKISADKTLIIVTHRNSILSLVDRIIIVEQGRVFADGPRDEILRMLSAQGQAAAQQQAQAQTSQRTTPPSSLNREP